MQAIRVERKRPLEPRWFQHLSLLSAVAFLFSWVVVARQPTTVELAESFPLPFLAPPSMPAQEWRPVRVPVRTNIVRDPSPPMAVAPTIGDAASVEIAVGATPEWAQAHRRTVLLSAPEVGATPALEIPQWGYLKILELRPDWVLVGFGGDDSGRPAGAAWVSARDIGASGPPPRFATSTRDTILWSTDGPGAEPLATVPRLATLALAGGERNGRVAVRLADERSDAGTAWVDWEAVRGSPGPSDRDVPLEHPFSPLANLVRLAVPYRSQLDGSLASGANCGPASIAMVLEAFGIVVPTTQARALATRSMGITSPWSGTTLESLRHAAEYYGLEGLDLHENGRYKRWKIDDLRRHLRAGHPVIPQLRYRLIPGREWSWVGSDHYVVITGLDGDDFLINDPVPWGTHGQIRLTAAQLTRAWMNSDAPGAALAIARPL